jgi:RND family efflux transporter MFP subunit
MKPTRRQLYALAAAALLALLAAAVWLRFVRAVAVPLHEVAQGAVTVRVTGPGTLQARVPVTLGARITATVRQVDADVGDRVQAGQVLAVLDGRDLAAQRDAAAAQQEALARNVKAAHAALARAQAELELAAGKHKRDAELLRTGFLSPQAIDTSDAGLRAAQANVDNARAALAAREAEAQAVAQEVRRAGAVLDYTRIVSPIDGVVVLRQAEAGTTVVPGTPIFRLVDPATLWIAMRVDESVVGRVQLGQPAAIRLRSGEQFSGKVARIARQADAAARELEVNVAFDAPPARFAIDQEAVVTIDTGPVSGLTLPLSALLRDRDGRQGVLVVADGRTQFRPVATGAADDARVLVQSGLAAGERVVVQPAGLRAGMRVRAAL